MRRMTLMGTSSRKGENMGLLDDLRDRLRGGGDDYDDDYYDDYDDDGYDDDYDDEPSGSGLLGNTPRPEAESVAVYTRSGRPVSSGNSGSMSSSSSSSRGSSRYGYSSRSKRADEFESREEPKRYTPPATSAYSASGQLPPYVLRAESYEDVQAVVRRVRTNQTVLLDLIDTPPDVAQRILDFCFGLSFGIDGEVNPIADKAFAILPAGMQLSASEAERLLSNSR